MKMNTIPLFLVTMYKGIGDAVLVGLSFVDQIIKEDPQAFGKIDVLCTGIQAEIFEHDPRVNRIILTNNSLFSPSEMTMWLNGIKLDAKTAALIRVLRDRHYAAVFAFMFAPGFYLRLHSTIVYPNLLQLGKDFMSLSRQVDVPMSKITRRMVSNYFRKKKLLADLSDDIPLYMSSEQVKNAKAVVKNIKKRSNVSPEASKLMVVASDTTSVISCISGTLTYGILPTNHLKTQLITRYPTLLNCARYNHSYSCAHSSTWRYQYTW